MEGMQNGANMNGGMVSHEGFDLMSNAAGGEEDLMSGKAPPPMSV